MLTVTSRDGVVLPLPASMMVHFDPKSGLPVSVRTIDENNPGVWQEWPTEYFVIFGAEMLMNPDEYTVFDNMKTGHNVRFVSNDILLQELKETATEFVALEDL